MASEDVDTEPSSHDAIHLEDKASSEDRRGNRGQGGGRGGKKGGGGGGQGHDVQVSRALSRLLRHQAMNAGIQLDGEGFAPLDRVVS